MAINDLLPNNINDTCEKAIDRPFIRLFVPHTITGSMTGRTMCVFSALLDYDANFCVKIAAHQPCFRCCHSACLAGLGLCSGQQAVWQRAAWLLQQPDMILCVNDVCVYADI